MYAVPYVVVKNSVGVRCIFANMTMNSIFRHG